jgi:hypothetical protein
MRGSVVRFVVAGDGAAGLVHGNAGRCPKHIAWARGLRPRSSTNSNRNNDKDDDPWGDIFT